MPERPTPPEAYRAINPEKQPEKKDSGYESAERIEQLMKQERREHDERLGEVIDAFVLRRNDDEAGKLDVVAKTLIARRDDKKTTAKIRTLILALSGAARGAYGTGQLAALWEAGITPREIDDCVGISAGSASLLYYLGGHEHTYKGASIYTHVLQKNGFVSFSVKRWPKIMNVFVAVKAFLKGPRAVDQSAVLAAPSRFWVVAQNTGTQKNELVDAKTDLINAVHASMAVPYFYGEKIQLRGGAYIDGAFAQIPFEEIIKTCKPTHILVMPNMPFEELVNFKISNGILKAVEWLLPEQGTAGVFKKVLRGEADIKSLRLACDEMSAHYGVKIGWLWPPDCALAATTTDRALLLKAMLASAKDAYRKFNKNNPDPGKREKRDFPFWN
ncbi:MAG: hypothetical protein A3J48_02680 [Candidatus Doudnabacteria bacterium RIFCSPHIGHO2_02_FULL_46_11]|uniref:PNPLA domain-containing protein n=1 Tax=Candidatus Doudnabacteria bacterium RIFCSPHIGHO2_02_FULL_46_11 TaxID=1817832 RepID=A0A1F5P859_9BACT|nr:MAG: hypothetical protein A3J48_02680 [Candidatus Doudnabacteria bacterium RIFCSPHIGHO2_02_FULL_46_11]